MAAGRAYLVAPLLLTWRPHDDEGVMLQVQVDRVDPPSAPEGCTCLCIWHLQTLEGVQLLSEPLLRNEGAAVSHFITSLSQLVDRT